MPWCTDTSCKMQDQQFCKHMPPTCANNTATIARHRKPDSTQTLWAAQSWQHSNLNGALCMFPAMPRHHCHITAFQCIAPQLWSSCRQSVNCFFQRKVTVHFSRFPRAYLMSCYYWKRSQPPLQSKSERWTRREDLIRVYRVGRNEKHLTDWMCTFMTSRGGLVNLSAQPDIPSSFDHGTWQ